MSSSLSSIILIGVVWLLIVATLFVRRHNPVRRTTRVLSETRVVHEGGTDLARPRRRPLPAESLYQADPDAAIELVDAEPEQVVIDDTQDDAVVINDAESDSEPEARPEAIPAVIEGDVVEYRTLDDEDTGEFAPVSVSDRPECEVAADAELTGADVVSDEETEEISAEPPAGPQPETPVLRDVSAAADGPRLTVIDDAYLRGSDIDTSVIAVDDLSGIGTDTEAETNSGASVVQDDGGTDEGGSDDLTDDDVEYAESRRGRGIYDPVASRALAEHRRRRRFRVLAALGVVTVLLLIAAVLAGGLVWITPVVGVALSGVYLYSLRKQTVAERELEHRRLSRMRRARLGVRNTDDGELGVPDRLRRPGAVVLEIDDADPEFAELDYAEVTFAVADAEPAVEDLPAVRVI